MSAYILYDAKGTIVQAGSMDPQSLANLSTANSKLVIDAYPADLLGYIQANYVKNGVVTPRQVMTPTVSATQIASDGTASSVISGLPDPCTVSISGPVTVAPTPVTGGTITITSNTPGTIKISVTADPEYLAWSTTINAV